MLKKLGYLAIAFAVVVYLAMGFIQLFAVIKGLQIWLSVPWIVAAFLSFVIAYIPVLGTIVGIKGAMDGWGWSLWPTIAFFCWPYCLYILVISVAGAAGLLGRKD